MSEGSAWTELSSRLGNLAAPSKIVLAVSAILGLPSLALASYLYSARVPFAFMDHTAISNFFLSFYLAAVLSFAVARVIRFFLELWYRLALMGWVIPRRRRQARTTREMIRWGEHVKNHPILGLKELRKTVSVLSRYERARLRGVLLGERSVRKIFRGLIGQAASAAIALIAFCWIFAGFRIVWFGWLIFFLGFPMLRAVRVGTPEHELEGVLKVAVNQAAIDLADEHGVSTLPPAPDSEDPTSKSNVRKRTSWIVRFARLPISALKEDAIAAASLMRADLGLLTLIAVLLSLGLGNSKYRSDVTQRVGYAIDGTTVSCIAPLLATGNHLIVHLHETSEIGLLPHDATSFFERGACREASEVADLGDP